jgi:hypothetical protein
MIIEFMNGKYEKINSIRKTMDRVAYCSLILDICIAFITTLSIFHIANTEFILIPINYMLTIVVILSMGLFITLFILKHEENIVNNLIKRKYQYKSNTNSLAKKLKIK